jgi:hypothetical protein
VTVDLAGLAAAAAGLELELDRAGWGQPLLTFALTPAGLAPLTVGGDVLDAARSLAPAAALLLAGERLVAGVTEAGDEVLVTRRPGDRAVVDRHPPRHPVLALLRRAQGLPSRPTGHPPLPGATWEELRAVAAAGDLDGFDPAAAAWMDADLFADWLVALTGLADGPG